MRHDNIIIPTAAIFALLFVSGCDWVDSAGDRQATTTVTDIFLEDDQVGNTIEVDEETEARITVSRQSAGSAEFTFSWDDTPLAQGNLESCATLDNFNSAIAVDSVSQACTDSDNCGLSFETTGTENNLAEFKLITPTLKAPVGVRFELSIDGSDGSSRSQEYDFCLISINEAPTAMDDTFSITEGETLRVGNRNSGERNLLSNDRDDEDAGNTQFRILTTAAEDPMHAAFFELGTDGDFTYQPNVQNLREDVLDRFVYTLSDGPLTATATVSIRITARNLAPEQLSDLPLISARESEAIAVDLAPFFSDPEGGNLSFSVAADSILPPSGAFNLSTGGLFSGTPVVGDAGSYAFMIDVSDGELLATALVSLEIALAPVAPPNRAPVFVSPQAVLNRTMFLGSALTPIRPRFTDPDGDILTYSISRPLPGGLSINPATGVISGVPDNRLWARNLVVTATDPTGATAQSSEFFILVQ